MPKTIENRSSGSARKVLLGCAIAPPDPFVAKSRQPHVQASTHCADIYTGTQIADQVEVSTAAVSHPRRLELNRIARS
ncbi:MULTISPECIES: hypothetical protein [Bradyrhizobium]|uniref:Uncharacterized protein n=1 Tax=Bradyrhizobium zhengyangense TaxID=2911009 RepID=A0A9X1RLW1_9BRAD|nr:MULTISPECIES: hypothetical protein [Bradyrhizobium]MCG2632620.1 hypothetical protein [Bradyrhizobium zhengyangense]MCG2645381.1 hypothetical protein [Bradyrhizobium zhengyangense]MCG2672853.1 hypothetical protein [Bradyrhizobium zhengyangense]MDN4985695.1 hypothetical protein [Bradyrhizobium sp. WYCCWR 13022]MDT4740896.1 hypothetical protein [Bradyrhizobium sp. WYCCWR 12699]